VASRILPSPADLEWVVGAVESSGGSEEDVQVAKDALLRHPDCSNGIYKVLNWGVKTGSYLMTCFEEDEDHYHDTTSSVIGETTSEVKTRIPKPGAAHGRNSLQGDGKDLANGLNSRIPKLRVGRNFSRGEAKASAERPKPPHLSILKGARIERNSCGDKWSLGLKGPTSSISRPISVATRSRAALSVLARQPRKRQPSNLSKGLPQRPPFVSVVRARWV